MPLKTPRRVLVVGLGSSGLAAARLAAADGAQVWVTDLRPAEQLAETIGQLPAGSRQLLGGHPAACLEGVELVLVSPGVPPQAPILEAARASNIPILTELEFAWQHRPEAELVAVTGSNGKSTVTMLVAEMLRAAGRAVAEGGNLGTPACELVLAPDEWQVWVLEVSSFQAELLTAMRPRVGIFLNLSQDHLERHPDMASYLAAKQRLFAHQQTSDLVILNADDTLVDGTGTGQARRLRFSLTGPADAWLAGQRLLVGDQPLLAADQLSLSGRHNIANALAAALAAHELGATLSQIGEALQRFRGLEHRHQTVLEHNGVRWVNDSKATNIGATIAALEGYQPDTVHLILGGLGKGQDFSLLEPEVRRVAAAVYLIGQDAPLIEQALAGAAPCALCGTLQEAVRRAKLAARAGQTVLLAPACASFDQFAGYDQRGDRYVELVQQEVAACH